MLYYKYFNPEPIYYFCEIEYIHKTEVFKPIVGYEGIYEVSDLGRFKSLERVILRKGVCNRYQYETILKPAISNNGYLRNNVSLYGNYKRISTHRLVALAFIDNPDNKPCVNHKDGNSLNSKLINLEWCTFSENELHSFRVLGKKHGMKGLKGYDNPNSINIIQMDLKGNFIKEFSSSKEASEILKIDGSAITKVCRGKRNKAGGFKWKYKQ